MKFRLHASAALALFGLVSGQTYALEDDHDKAQGLYLGAQLTAPDVKVELDDITYEANGDVSDIAHSFLLGYQFSFHNGFRIDADIEYRELGSIQSDQVSIASGEAYLLNLRPKYVVSEGYADYYLALTLGIGEMELDYAIIDVTEVTSQSEFVSEIGIEYGLIFNNGIGVGIGYRTTTTEKDAIEFTLDGVYGTVRYQF